MTRRSRAGFSLLEVLLATGILLACLLVLGELAAVGRKHVDHAERLTIAQAICQTKLNEILVGASPAEPVESQPVESPPGWVYSVQVEPLDRLGMVSIRVAAGEDFNESEATEDGAAEQFAVTRWMHRPSRESVTSNSPSELPDGSSFGHNYGGAQLR